MSAKRTAIIIGGGPAGLTTALELLERTDIKPIVYEGADNVGGIARTYLHAGNRIDIGGHRFFSKSDRVMDWWSRILPLQGRQDGRGGPVSLGYQNKSRWLDMPADGPNPDLVDDVMLVRARKSRILWGGTLFDYPLSLNLATLRKLGLGATMLIGFSFLRSQIAPIRPEKSLQDFFINRFGRRLYDTFFKDYTEKVWGVPCAQISAEWGAQRVKGLSLSGIVKHALGAVFRRRGDVAQKDLETSLIEQFLYPKHGPGQMWERVADLVRQGGGEVHTNCRVTGLQHANGQIIGATMMNGTGAPRTVQGDYYFSTTDVRQLMGAMEPAPPAAASEVSKGLIYRDFITVGLLLQRLKLGGDATGRDIAEKMSDNWIYVQEPGVKVGRLQFFNNWSPYLVANPEHVWIGLEYFCDEGDALWTRDDAALSAFAIEELQRINVIEADAVLDHVVIRVPKTYPAYFGSYDRFDEVREFTDSLENLYLLGRNGMHRYNNMDHSMLTAMVAVDNIIAEKIDKANIWSVNTEADYHEEK
ncbi:MAG: NAD(P)/FAD-dependent oxidoreductase [Alphaproteobacteria bacterium]|nr:NAD(P)/FAD-dependent oxidoreductase [Alphaproteobacteria bacterium]MBL6951302.1 NAD(P)/FAD-dependent oxidoreductase [Alphaproteobacteria bacterium]